MDDAEQKALNTIAEQIEGYLNGLRDELDDLREWINSPKKDGSSENPH